MRELHPAALTMVSLVFIVAATIVHDPAVLIGWSAIASLLLLLGRLVRPRALLAATASGLAMGFGLAMNHGFFPAPGADPYRAWAHCLRPAVLIQWSLFLSGTDPVRWAESLHRFWRLPLSWTYAAQASFRFLPLLAREMVLSADWRRLHRRGGKPPLSSMVTLLVSALRFGAQSALALEARGLSADRTWLRPLRWRPRDSAFVVLTICTGILWLWALLLFLPIIRLWDGAF